LPWIFILSEVHSSVGWVSYFKENSWGCICKILRDMLPVGSGRVRNLQLEYLAGINILTIGVNTSLISIVVIFGTWCQPMPILVSYFILIEMAY
jgi:hypothetical protein